MIAIALLALFAMSALAFCHWYMLDGPHPAGPVGPRNVELEGLLAAHVGRLAGTIGERKA